MKRITLICLLLALLLAGWNTLAEGDEELVFTPANPAESKDDGEKSELDEIKDQNAALLETLGQKNWERLASAVPLTGSWRDDLIDMAASQLGYQQARDGHTPYTLWAGQEAGTPWSALFVNWAADRIGLTESQFPHGADVPDLLAQMDELGAVKAVSRAAYPSFGDIAVIEKGGATLVGVIATISDGYAAVIHGDDGGRVTRESYYIGGREFTRYIDLNVLMARAGVDSGKGGEAPAIPEGGVAGWTTTNAVYLREKPTTASRSLTTIKKANTALLVTGAALQEDGYIWYAVTCQGHRGYIRGDLLQLDAAALPTAAPAPTPAPAGCGLCGGASLGVALPVDCPYAHLAAMPQLQAGRYMAALLDSDTSLFVAYLSCCTAHIRAGEEDLLCLGMDCASAAWTASGPAHDLACPWHYDGLTAQAKVVNIEIRQATAGQEILLAFEVYGASAYQWYEKSTPEGASEPVATALPGEQKATLLVTAGEGQRSYYCVATVLIGGEPFALQSKETVLAVDGAPVVAHAILGEEINFTYTASADSLQWYVQLEDAAPAAIPGATEATLTFAADLERSGAAYFCVARDETGAEIARSGSYGYAIRLFAEQPDYTRCEPEKNDLCRYIEELAQMNRAQRHTALTETWRVSMSRMSENPGSAELLVSYVLAHYRACHQTALPGLLCSCASPVAHPYEAVHAADCPWYIAPVTDDAGNQAIPLRQDQAEFDKWCLTATEAMIARAKTVPTLDHVVFEPLGDATWLVYIARYEAPVGTVDARGFLTYRDTVIAWINFATGRVHPIQRLPDSAPAL